MSLLGILALVLQLLRPVLIALEVDQKYQGVAGSVSAAIDSLQAAHDQVITKAHLESLRTEPKW